MLYLILCYFLVTCICLWAGILFYSFVRREIEEDRSLVHYLLTGLIAVTAVGQWIVLFFPLRFTAWILVLSLASAFTAIRRKVFCISLQRCLSNLRGKDRMFFLCLACFLVMVLVLNAGPVMMDDTGSYHIQMVKWINEFGSVPGIANLHLRFGFNSSWFVSVGLLSVRVQGLNSYMSLNGILAVWFCYYLLDKCFIFFLAGKASASYNRLAACLVILILCLADWPMIRGCSTSANYDFITTCCVVVLMIDFASDSCRFRIEWFIWPVYLFTVRMTNFPFLLLSLLYFLQGIKPFGTRKIIFCISASFFLIIPFLVRNFILSGYAFFPAYQLNFFSCDWKADKEKLVEITEYIKYFNRVNPMFLPMNKTRQLAFPDWMTAWYRYLFTVDRWLVTLSGLGYAIVGIRAKRFFSSGPRIFMTVMIIQLVTWFFIAPDPRFVQGSLLFGIYLGIENGPTLAGSLGKWMKMVVWLVSLTVLIYGVSKIRSDRNYKNFFSPKPLPQPRVETIVVDQIQLHIPFKVLNNWNPRCYDVTLPCLYRVDPRLEARGKSISDGFRLKKKIPGFDLDGEYKIKDQ